MNQLEQAYIQNAQLVEDLQAQLAEAKTQIAAASAGKSSTFLDTRVLGKPENFDGAEARWPDWSIVVCAYMSLVNAKLGVLLAAAETEIDVEKLSNDRIIDEADRQAHQAVPDR